MPLPDERWHRALPVAVRLVDAVHLMDSRLVSRALADVDLPAVAVALAAMVDDTKTLRELLAWTDTLDTPCEPIPILRPCGTHAAYERHRKRGETVCAACRKAEREYQRSRPDRRLGARKTTSTEQDKAGA